MWVAVGSKHIRRTTEAYLDIPSMDTKEPTDELQEKESTSLIY